MEKKTNLPPNPDNWKSLPFPIKLYIGWIIFRSVHWVKIERFFLTKIQRVDLWLFPPLMFLGIYRAISQIVPDHHPMAFITAMATSLMGMTFSLFLIRPPKKKLAHWIN